MSWPPDLRSELAGLYDGDIVHHLVCGTGPFQREQPFEPTLLPHLARLCHPQSITEIARTAEIFDRGHPQGWPQVYESSLNVLVQRFDDAQLENGSWGILDAVTCQVRRCVLESRSPSPSLLERIEQEPDSSKRQDWMARLLLVDPRSDWYEELRDQANAWSLSVEGIRALLRVAAQRGEGDWGRIEHWLGNQEWPGPHEAHLLDVLPAGPERTALADRLVELANMGPPWFTAVLAQHLRPFVSGSVPWAFDTLWDPDGLWLPFLEYLMQLEPAPDPHEELLRAHPFAHILAGIEGPHETTIGLTDGIMNWWAGAGPPASEPEMVAPEPGDGGSGSEPPSPPGRDDRRLGVDFYLGDRRLERALVAKQALRLRVSIGHEATAQVEKPIEVGFAPDQDSRTLQVRVVLGEGFDECKPLALRRDPAVPGFADFDVQVPGVGLSGLVVVYDEDGATTLQAASLEAAVVATAQEEATAAPSISLRLVDASSLAALGRPASSATIVSNGEATVAATRDVQIPATVGMIEDLIEKTAHGIQVNAQRFLAAGASTDRAIVKMAQFGARLREDLSLSALDASSPIQVVSFYKRNVLPIEWVYGDDVPDDDATVCAEWTADGAGGARCPACDARDAAQRRALVCPSRFWGFSKVIEHHGLDEEAESQFVARVQRGSDEEVVALQGEALVSASAKVFEQLEPSAGSDDPNVLLADLIAAASDFGPVTLAKNWDDWREAVGQKRPSVLIAMPHQEDVEELGFSEAALELGGDFETTVREDLVRPAGAQPGPIVLLLGCNSGVERHFLASFASKFRKFAPAVVATVGEVLAAEAQLVALQILECLDEASRRDGATLGDAIRDARARLVARSRMVGFQLTLHGDATWRIGG